MTDLRGKVTMSHAQVEVACRAAGKPTTASFMAGNGNWDSADVMGQTTMASTGDAHIAEDEFHVRGKVKGDDKEYKVENAVPEEEEEEDGVYIIEFSNAEDEGESYKIMMSMEQSGRARENADFRAPLRPQRQVHDATRKRKIIEKEDEVEREELMSKRSVLELEEDCSNVTETNSDSGTMCTMCPPPGRFFKSSTGLILHLRFAHRCDLRKRIKCTTCNQVLRDRHELDAHTKRHARQNAVFTCVVCSHNAKNTSEDTGFKGSRGGLRLHLLKEHPGVIPRCDICNRDFKMVSSYLNDLYKHVRVSPFYCSRCQTYHMSERNLVAHVKDHCKYKNKNEESDDDQP